MSPVMRGIAIAVLILTPLGLVILQRLDAIREIRHKRQKGELDLSPQGLFTHSEGSSPSNTAPGICPQCNKLNPADHQFCGYCGASLNTQGENKK